MKDVSRGLLLLFIGVTASEILGFFTSLSVASFGSMALAAASISTSVLGWMRFIVHLLLIAAILCLPRIRQPLLIPICVGAFELLMALCLLILAHPFAALYDVPADIFALTAQMLRMAGLGMALAAILAAAAGYLTVQKPLKLLLIIMGAQLLICCLMPLVLFTVTSRALAAGLFLPFATLLPAFSLCDAQSIALPFKLFAQSNAHPDAQPNKAQSYLEAYKQHRKG